MEFYRRWDVLVWSKRYEHHGDRNEVDMVEIKSLMQCKVQCSVLLVSPQYMINISIGSMVTAQFSSSRLLGDVFQVATTTLVAPSS